MLSAAKRSRARSLQDAKPTTDPLPGDPCKIRTVRIDLRSHACRATRPACSPGRCAGSRRCRAATEGIPLAPPVRRQGFRRQRLQLRSGRQRHQHRCADRPQDRRPDRLRRSSAALGGGAHLRLARPQPSSRKGLRGHDRLGNRLPLRRLCHAPHAPSRALRMSFDTGSKRHAPTWARGHRPCSTKKLAGLQGPANEPVGVIERGAGADAQRFVAGAVDNAWPWRVPGVSDRGTAIRCTCRLRDSSTGAFPS